MRPSDVLRPRQQADLQRGGLALIACGELYELGKRVIAGRQLQLIEQREKSITRGK
ncbi:hypothetical protein D3C80_1598730 [compost metagenome]